MRKQNKKMPTVEMLTIDELGILSDLDLDIRYKNLATEREKALQCGHETKQIEEELCYIQREIQLRNRRIDAHIKWLETVRREYEVYDDSWN